MAGVYKEEKQRKAFNSFRYLTGERSVVLLEIDFDADNQDDIVRTVKKLSDLMCGEILNYHKQKNYFVEEN